MKPFKNQLSYDTVKTLCSVANNLNGSGYQSGQDEAFGDCIRAIENILTEQFGAVVADLAMNSTAWCVASFESQVIPAIEATIEENEVAAFSSGYDAGNYGHAYENSESFSDWFASKAGTKTEQLRKDSGNTLAWDKGTYFGWHSSLEDSEVESNYCLTILNDEANNALCRAAGIVSRKDDH